ncbi:Modification methylase, putative [Streptococcus sanguinis SK36]|uniref:Cytosine-specific methyltransferase n=1 Tax=Streptococcus sanguinis (strain SK36) TaxID=388919 RepID=A3CPT9_STRSV|nr:DNA (cytosine-5-)-methyltransferase [Streptococcus sanguinis]ABN45194.1 Modification methylase, putative [Streptococcus sanguinis SK36]MBZ2055277.1 DNA (cytosine-5-)-methyltransferase [Streptococcus sanguinis]
MIETFSGIGSQTQALKNLRIDHKVVAIAEWDISAMYAYDILHNGEQDIKSLRHHTKESLISVLSRYNLSSNGKNPITLKALKSMSIAQLKAIYLSIERNNNLVDISEVHSQDLPDADILTYSFPCQDLSVSGYWHNNTSGIDRDAENRSTLLWQIERILKEYVASQKKLPRFLLMENVSNILSQRHIDNFNEWKTFLESLGYINKVYTLDARNFGVPQARKRTFMLSVLAENDIEIRRIDEYLNANDLQTFKTTQLKNISDFLRLDYSVEKYKKEAIESTPRFTESRKKIFRDNIVLATGTKINASAAKTVTTKQDRNPNSGIIKYAKNDYLVEWNTHYRNLTPRECFMLMGFKEEQFDLLLLNNFENKKGSYFLTASKLIKMAGNSIVVPILEEIFKQMEEIKKVLD